jgi:lysozyme
MEVSQKLIDFTRQSEGFRAKPYMDNGSLAIGYGHHGPEVKPGLVWTEEQADAAQREDFAEFGKQVEHLVKVPLTQGQFDALVDFVYNLGSGRLEESTLLKLLNQRAYVGASQQFLRWDNNNGKPDDNLLARRRQELQLFWNS